MPETTKLTEAPKGAVLPDWMIGKLVSYGLQTAVGKEAMDTFIRLQPNCPPGEQIEFGYSVEEGRFWFKDPPPDK